MTLLDVPGRWLDVFTLGIRVGLLLASADWPLEVRGMAGELERDDAGVGSAFAGAFVRELVVAPLEDVLSLAAKGPGGSYGYG